MFPGTATRGFEGSEKGVAVCMRPGTELSFRQSVMARATNPLEGLRNWFACLLGIRLGAFGNVATFTQLNPGVSGIHHDALGFPDGRTLLLQDVATGQIAKVLTLPRGEEAHQQGAKQLVRGEPLVDASD